MTNPADPHFPSSRDLVDEIRFDTGTGKIWFHEQRMLLTHSSLFAELRDELIETIGLERARSLIMRLGYHSGRRDAEMARSLRPDLGAMAAFYAGPQLAAIKGMVHINPVRIDVRLAGEIGLGGQNVLQFRRPRPARARRPPKVAPLSQAAAIIQRQDDEALVDKLVAPGHPSTQFYTDPMYPVRGRAPRTAA